VIRIYKTFHKNPLLRLKVMAHRVADSIEEYQLGIDTQGLIPIETLLENWAGNHDYAPTSIRSFRTFMAKIDLVEDEVFLDYGCGKGRVIIMAAQYPFRRVIGVEIALLLAEAARKNIKVVSEKLACKRIEVHCESADKMEVPPDVSVVYFYNPFHGPMLGRVLDNLRASLEKTPRRMRVIYNNPTHFKKISHQYPWLVARHHFSLEHECIIYESML